MTARRERRRRQGVTGRARPLAVREAADQKAGEVARDGSVAAVPGGVSEASAGLA